MTQVAFSSSFKRAFKKRIEGRKELEEKFWRRVEIFTANPHDSRLRTHKLSGELREQWSFTIEYDLRVVFSFLPNNRAVFEDIGSHERSLLVTRCGRTERQGVGNFTRQPRGGRR